MFKRFLAIFLVLLLTFTTCMGNAFALGDDVDIPIMDDEDEEFIPETPSGVEDFEHLNAGSVKVDITNSSELFTKSGDTYKPFPTGPAPSGDKWGMFTNFAYPTYKLVDGEYVEIENPSKNGTYCGDTHFPINAIKGDYQHTYYTSYTDNQNNTTDTVTVTPHSGDTMIGLGQIFRTNVKAVENLEPYTDYTLSFWVYQTVSGYLNTIVVADNYDGIKTTATTPFSDDCNVLGSASYDAKDVVYNEWTKISVNFSTTDKTTAYLHLSQVGLGTNGVRSMVFFDDLLVEERKPEAKVDDFEHLNAGSVKVDITNSSEFFTKNGDTYKPFPTGPAPSGDKWGMFTNFSYPTYRLIDGEHVAIENPSKNGTYCGDNYFPIKAIKGAYTHTYYTDFATDPTLLSTVTVTPHSGNTMIGMGQMHRTGIKAIENLEPYTDYDLSIWVYSANTSGYVYSLVVADNYDGIQTNGLTAFSTDCNVLGATNYPDSTLKYGEWEELKVSFSTTDKTTAYLHISQVGSGTDGNKGMIFLDDLSVQQMENKYLSVKELTENNLITTQGAATRSGNSLLLEYSADGFSFTANCEGTVRMSVSPNVYNANWDLRLALHVNGERQSDIVLTPTTTEVILAYGLEKGNYTFKIEKMGEAQIGKILVNSISLLGGMKTPPAKPEMHIDYYGDSITAGWGTTAYSGSPTNPYQYMDGSVTYAAVASNILGSDFTAFGYSGWGVAVTGGSNGKGDKTMTTIYPDLRKNLDADVVVINLGTNDADKYVAAELTEQYVKDAYLAYAKNIRNDYGANTPIVFAYGMMTDSANGFIDYAVEGMKAEGDNNVYSVRLPKGTSGGVAHPDAAEQYAAGEVLADFIKEISKTYAGDIDGDKNANLKDLVALAQQVAGWENIAVNQKVVDVNGDGTVDLADVNVLAKYLAGWPDIAVKGDVYMNYSPVSHTLKEIEDKLKLNSRATFDGDVLRMEWSASGFTIQGQFSGDIVLNDVAINSNYGAVLCYAILDNDYDNPVQLRIVNGNNTLLNNVEAGFHTVQLLKATEASGAQMTVGGITYNGAIFDAPAEKELKIQFIGDSITSSGGLYTEDVEPDALLRSSDTTKGYAYKVANHYGADLSIVSVSGGTICTRTPSLQDYYQKLFFSKDGAYDFSTETEPDLVIVALGTNDTPTYNTNNVPNDNVDVLKQGIKNMLTLVREKNPNAKILWAYGMMATNIASVYKEAVEEFNATDGNTYYTMINRNDCTGSGGHPTPNGHTLNAKEYINFIENNIWVD